MKGLFALVISLFLSTTITVANAGLCEDACYGARDTNMDISRWEKDQCLKNPLYSKEECYEQYNSSYRSILRDFQKCLAKCNN
ncbi:MAG: hypothetical protein HQK53_08480 [Oligoflexia bacterium]|nr:hypothetical protein [Oligoflexia bacterium]